MRVSKGAVAALIGVQLASCSNTSAVSIGAEASGSTVADPKALGACTVAADATVDPFAEPVFSVVSAGKVLDSDRKVEAGFTGVPSDPPSVVRLASGEFVRVGQPQFEFSADGMDVLTSRSYGTALLAESSAGSTIYLAVQPSRRIPDALVMAGAAVVRTSGEVFVIANCGDALSSKLAEGSARSEAIRGEARSSADLLLDYIRDPEALDDLYPQTSVPPSTSSGGTVGVPEQHQPDSFRPDQASTSTSTENPNSQSER